eukprot:5438572-Amphidinium_carterae.3
MVRREDSRQDTKGSRAATAHLNEKEMLLTCADLGPRQLMPIQKVMARFFASCSLCNSIAVDSVRVMLFSLNALGRSTPVGPNSRGQCDL